MFIQGTEFLLRGEETRRILHDRILHGGRNPADLDSDGVGIFFQGAANIGWRAVIAVGDVNALEVHRTVDRVNLMDFPVRRKVHAVDIGVVGMALVEDGIDALIDKIPELDVVIPRHFSEAEIHIPVFEDFCQVRRQLLKGLQFFHGGQKSVPLFRQLFLPGFFF